jgi:hypothetical protein
MTIIRPSLSILLLAAALPAQIADQGTLIERRAGKLESPFLENALWHTDYDDAREDAAESGKPIFAYFSRSYEP